MIEHSPYHCARCNDTGWVIEVLSGVGEPPDWKWEPCDCPAGARAIREERELEERERREAQYDLIGF